MFFESNKNKNFGGFDGIIQTVFTPFKKLCLSE